MNAFGNPGFYLDFPKGRFYPDRITVFNPQSLGSLAIYLSKVSPAHAMHYQEHLLSPGIILASILDV